MSDARELLIGLTGRPIRTITHSKQNKILRLDGDTAVVATDRSPSGRAVPIAWVQQALDALYRDGELQINKRTLGHRRTAFVGAVLRELPDVDVLTDPQRLVVRAQR
jgi:hypothetical protein